MGRLIVCLCADTEDNHPNYLPGWSDMGTDYDHKEVKPRFDWLKYWKDLIRAFDDFKVTWFLRTDTCIRDKALKKFKPHLRLLKKHEVGIHIHALVWDGKIWRQSQDPKKDAHIVHESMNIFRETLSFTPVSSRMGWNYMNNSIMQALQQEGIQYDASAVPGYVSSGFFNHRDNIINWEDAPTIPYRPSKEDYRKMGSMEILEMPISSHEAKNLVYNDTLTRLYNLVPRAVASRLLPGVLKAAQKMHLRSHSNFVISPNWDIEQLFPIIDLYAEKAKKKDTLLVGYFHPCDVLDPNTGRLNNEYLNKISRLLSHIRTYDPISMTLSEAGEEWK